MSDELGLDVDVRKIVTFIEEVHTEGGRGDEGGPLKKVAVAVVFKNPYADKPFTEDLSELVKASAGLGTLIGEMFAATEGLGFMLIKAIDENDVALLMSLALFLFLVAAAANGILLALDHRLHRRSAQPSG